jgi:hypothetical protein
VIAWGRAFLDEIAPLTGGSHADVDAYRVEDGRLVTDRAALPILRCSPERAKARSSSATTISTSKS